jgi:putative oxidoreductase
MLQNLTLLLARVLLSAIFIQAGFHKLMGPVSSMASIAKLGLPMPQAGWVVAVAVELGGGLLILLGFRVRLVALALAAFCVATGLAAHYHPADAGQMIHFMKNLAIAGGFLQLAATGPGRFAIGGGRS